ncbi:Vacuolar H+transporting two-sector ATPase F subunit [Fervidicella metallireducens AeB]|uniref:Vacuolar H+transporting two-sector ATPase F subunit n=1 Tax=Fervidicella metallireducens AeB TaxID=1403537 RepID=A0A017RYG5_9CLOT|nr:V-type ATP synthase subunit F [Fervidicella metallireducens]EYE88975.1 Vacuolar H+transporting two-sector ATPase F subunit [Fervidicella metallireducens AeB]
MRIYLISDNRDTLVGMRIAGIKGTLAESADEAEKLIDNLLKDKEIGIILITERLGREIKNKISHIKEKMVYPLIIEVPDRHGSIKDEDYITGYVKDSIGIKF